MQICEIFRSLQGEGLLMGLPCAFVRTAGCNLDCAWCDTVYAKTDGTEMSIGEIMDRLRSYDLPLVCITGGEPLIQEETYRLVDTLLQEGYTVQLETNGSLPLDRLPCDEALMISMDIKTPSSGMQDAMLLENLEILSSHDQLKFVVSGPEDMRYVEDILGHHAIACPVIVTPVGGVELRAVVEWVLEASLNVRVLPQLQKLIWGEERGH
jgi:7-carboxy-7-deazaguanine synthase